MTTAYTSLLGLALPVTGELSGTWGDTVNTAITSLLDTAIAGTTSITTDADITLSTTTGASNQARQAIILWNPASGTTTRNITAPAQSKMYVVINASGGTQSIVIRGVGPTTGVTIAKGESATVAWNGSDFVKVSSSGGAITFTDLTVTGNTILGDAAADTLTVNATSTFAAPVNFQGQVKLPSTGRSAAAALTVTNPAFLYGVASTYTDTTSSGTIAAMAPFYGIAAPTLSTSNVTTYSFASTLYIAGAPTAGGSATITNPYALYVNSGASYLAGTLAVGGNATFASNVTLGDAAADTVTVNGTITSNLIFTDNTYDIGAAVATRPRNLYVGTSITVSSNGTYGMYAYNSTNTRKVWFATSSVNTLFYNTDATGAIAFRNAADSAYLGYWTDAGVLMLGGVSTNTASSPILFVNAASNQTVAAFGSLNAWSASTTNNAGISVGCYYNGVWNATATSGTFYQQIAGAHNWYANAGLTIGSTFSESKVMTVDYTGYLLNQSTVAAGVVRHESLNLSTAASSTADFVARVGAGSTDYVQIQATQAGPGYLTFGATQTSGNIIVAGNYSLNIQTNSTNRMAIANDGRVAIGYGATFAQQLNENQLTVFGSANASAFVTTGGASTSPILSWSKSALAGGTTFTGVLDILAGATYTSYGLLGVDSDGYAGIKSNVYNVVLDSYTGITNFHYRGNKWGIEVGVDGTATNVHYLQSYDRASSSYRPLGLIGQTVRMYNSATETWRFESNNLVAQVNNAGIQFKNTSALTNSVLNDYETGNWTMSMSFGGTACTVNSQTCTYTKVGRLVIATVQASGITKNAGSGSCNLGGLPFASVGSYCYGFVQFNDYSTVIYSVLPFISGTGSRMLAQAPSGGASAHRDINNSDLPATFNFYGSFVYEANF